MTPNRMDIVRAVDSDFPHLLTLNTIASCGEFTERVLLRLHAIDPNWGLLSKQPGEKQHRGHGIDSGIYLATQQVVDVIAGAGARDDGDLVSVGKPAWSEEPKRPGNNWMLPIAVAGGGPVDKPPIDLPPAEKPPVSGVDDAAIRRIVQDELAKPRKVALETHDGRHYLCAEGGGGGEVNATRRSPGVWETFTVVPWAD